MPEEDAPSTSIEKPRVIEGPSATTDPDNANSGPIAYVLFGLAIGVLALMLMSLTSCVDALGTLVANHSEGISSSVPHDTHDEWDDEWDEMWDDLENDFADEDFFGGLEGPSEPTSRA